MLFCTILLRVAKLIPFYQKRINGIEFDNVFIKNLTSMVVFKKIGKILFLASIISCCYTCDNAPTPEPIPYRFVNKIIDLNNLAYQRLKFDGGFVYEEGGVRGIIIYRKNANMYYAFERNCPYRPYDACAQVQVDISGFFMLDECCKSYFDFEGNPTSGPAFSPMLRYRTSLAGSILTITN